MDFISRWYHDHGQHVMQLLDPQTCIHRSAVNELIIWATLQTACWPIFFNLKLSASIQWTQWLQTAIHKLSFMKLHLKRMSLRSSQVEAFESADSRLMSGSQCQNVQGYILHFIIIHWASLVIHFYWRWIHAIFIRGGWCQLSLMPFDAIWAQECQCTIASMFDVR